MTLDLNGYTLSNGRGPKNYVELFNITNGGNLTIEDTSESNKGTISLKGKSGGIKGINVNQGGVLNLNSGTINIEGISNLNAVYVEGTFNINGGQIKADNGATGSGGSFVYVTGANAVLNMKAGSISNLHGGKAMNVHLINGASAYISGGTISAVDGAGATLYLESSSTATLSGYAMITSGKCERATVYLNYSIEEPNKLIILDNAKIENTGDSGKALFVGEQKASVEMNGGSITNLGANGTALEISGTSEGEEKAGEFILNNGIIENTSENSGNAVILLGKMVVNDGKIIQKNEAEGASAIEHPDNNNYPASFSMNGGAIESGSEIIDRSFLKEGMNGEATISEGSFNKSVSDFVASNAAQAVLGENELYIVGAESIKSAANDENNAGKTLTVTHGSVTFETVNPGIEIKTEAGASVTIGTNKPSGNSGTSSNNHREEISSESNIGSTIVNTCTR